MVPADQMLEVTLRWTSISSCKEQKFSQTFEATLYRNWYKLQHLRWVTLTQYRLNLQLSVLSNVGKTGQTIYKFRKLLIMCSFYVKISFSFSGKDLLPFQFTLNPLMTLQILMISLNQNWIQVSLSYSNIIALCIKNIIIISCSSYVVITLRTYCRPIMLDQHVRSAMRVKSFFAVLFACSVSL